MELNGRLAPRFRQTLQGLKKPSRDRFSNL